ncbi:MAG: hypothetical protein WD934_05145 [Gemmatimonadales bacterium]
MKRIAVGLALGAIVTASPAAAQLFGPARTAVLYESYAFDPGLIFDQITQLTVPIGMDLRLGRLGTLATSTGFTRITLRSTDVGQLANQDLSGMLDTELRLSVPLSPGRLIAIATGVLPTGVSTVEQSQLSILGAISSDIIGFAAPSVGSGGSVGGGLIGVVPLGRFALGFGATYRLPLAYQPVLGNVDDLQPGAEIRLRAALEGGLSRQTFTRLALIYAVRSKDQVASQTQNGVGNRLIAYLSVNQQLGRMALTLYGFDVFRGEPQIEGSTVGAAILPRGNLLAGGMRLAIPLGQATEFTPRFELRVSTAAADTAAAPMERLGQSMRFGFDLRRRLSPGASLVAQGGMVSGSVRQANADIGMSGWRTALHLELHR